MSSNSSQSRRSSASGPVLRSMSPCGRYPNTTPTASYYINDVASINSSSSLSSFASSTSLSFYSSSPQTAFFTGGNINNDNNINNQYQYARSSSPTRVNLYTTSSSPSPSFRFSLGHRSSSPSRSIPSVTVTKQTHKKACMCSPTTHRGSFRCSLHKNNGNGVNVQHSGNGSGSYTPNRLNMRRSAMKNSIVRIGGVEGDWVKRALTALIRPSSHQQRRRGDFQSRPSRLSIMSKAGDDVIS